MANPRAFAKLPRWCFGLVLEPAIDPNDLHARPKLDKNLDRGWNLSHT